VTTPAAPRSLDLNHLAYVLFHLCEFVRERESEVRRCNTRILHPCLGSFPIFPSTNMSWKYILQMSASARKNKAQILHHRRVPRQGLVARSNFRAPPRLYPGFHRGLNFLNTCRLLSLSTSLWLLRIRRLNFRLDVVT